MAKRTGSQGHDVETLTPEREALEHPHILFRLPRDPLLVAMNARELDKPAPRKPTAVKGDGAKRGRG